MRRKTETGTTEYPVSPDDIAQTLAANVAFSTDILTPNTICVLCDGAQRTVVDYRPPQKTALWLEGLEDPVRVPLPALLLIRRTFAKSHPKYLVYAVAERPNSFQTPLFHTPLPNTYPDGSICWGTVAKPQPSSLPHNDLSADWGQFLGSHFGNHGVDRKCRSHPDDIRKLYLEMEKRQTRVYPKRELLPARRTLGSVLEVNKP